jgi:uncharacterized protein YacL
VSNESLGIVLGLVFALIVSRPLAEDGFVFTIPIGTLIAVFILAGIAGVVAAIPPARRAAKVDVLRSDNRVGRSPVTGGRMPPADIRKRYRMYR